MQTNLDSGYYVVKYAQVEKLRGCPALLKGQLNQRSFEWDTRSPPPADFRPSKDYVFKAKHQVIDFDFNPDHHFIASAKFCKLCESLGVRFIRVPLQIIQSNGKRTDKEYFYFLCLDWTDALDISMSELKFSQDLTTGEVLKSASNPARPSVEAIFSAMPMVDNLLGRHLIRASDMRGAFVCSSLFVKEARRLEIIGCDFVPFESYRDVPFWLAKDTER